MPASTVADIVSVVHACEAAARPRLVLSDEILDGAAALNNDERVRLKTELAEMGIKIRDWWQLVQKRVAAGKKMRVVKGDAQPKPRVVLQGGDLSQMTVIAIKTLGERAEVFAREREFVTAMDARDDKPPHIVPLNIDTIRVLLADSISWSVFVDDEPKSIDPPHNVVAGAFACPWKRDVRVLEQIIESPTIRPDGSLVDTPGYDGQLRVLYQPNAEFPEIPEAPTQQDAIDALVALREVFQDFPCETESDRMILVASVITMVCRAAIPGPVPAFGISANTSGTGKSMAVEMATLIATGRAGEGKGWPIDEVELGNQLDSAAIESSPVLWFDNLDKPFGGAILCSYLTFSTARPRDFGRKRTVLCPWRTVIFGTGNNLQLGRDMHRRTLVCHMLNDRENPHLIRDDEKRFTHYPLEPWVRENRPRLVAAVLTLVRAWILAKRPRGTQPALGAFDAWSRFVPDCIEWAGSAESNPLARAVKPGAEDANDEDVAFSQFLSGLKMLAKDSAGLKARDIVSVLYPDGAPGKGDGYDELREAIEGITRKKNIKGVPEAHALGTWLRARKNQRRHGLVLIGTTDRKDITLWSVQDTNAPT